MAFCDVFRDFRYTHLPIASLHTTSPSAPWTGDRRQASLQRTLKPRRSTPSARLRLHLPITSLHRTLPSAPWTGHRSQVTVLIAAYVRRTLKIRRSATTTPSATCAPAPI